MFRREPWRLGALAAIALAAATSSGCNTMPPHVPALAQDVADVRADAQTWYGGLQRAKPDCTAAANKDAYDALASALAKAVQDANVPNNDSVESALKHLQASAMSDEAVVEAGGATCLPPDTVAKRQRAFNDTLTGLKLP